MKKILKPIVYLIFLITLCVFSSCNRKPTETGNSNDPQFGEKITGSISDIKPSVEDDDKIEVPENEIMTKLEHFQIREAPMLLSTNWDDHRRIAPLSEEQKTKFNISKIISQRPEFENAYFQINERINLSKKFLTILFNVGYSDGNQLSAILVIN